MVEKLEWMVQAGLSLRAGGRGFPPATMSVAPRLLLLENRRKLEPKETPRCLIPHLLVVFTRQLEILTTTLYKKGDFYWHCSHHLPSSCIIYVCGFKLFAARHIVTNGQ